MAAFWGAAELLTHGFLDPVAVVPLLVGIVLIATLIVYEYRARHPLLILRNLVSTIPITGVVVAIKTAAAATSAIALTSTVQAGHYTPLHLGLLYIPELAAAVVTAFVFGRIFSTRFIHYYALFGLVILAAGVLVLRSVIPPDSALTLVGLRAGRHRHRRLGRAGAVPGWVLAALGFHPARFRDPGAAAGDRRVPDRADSACTSRSR